jgi:uncharacterized membrane protein
VEAYIIDWFSVIVRWLHLITGIAWIGASFHFVWLDNSLEAPTDDEQKQGVKGTLWAIHGGGIYSLSKYQLAPPVWPAVLHWSKWEAYSTWLTGTLLMVAVYYFQAQSYLVGPDNWITNPAVAVLASVSYVFGGLALYELAIRSALRNNQRVFAICVALSIVVLAWLGTRLFSDRAAFLHIGALMGSIMAGNVFFGIIPAQKRFVAAVEAGEQPDAAAAAFAKQRSTFNNYFTLPVLFCMISNHYPFLYAHAWNWVILVAILAITAYARHFFNLRHQGIVRPAILVQATLAFLLLAGLLGYDRFQPSTALPQLGAEAIDSAVVSDAQVLQIVATHCTGCHAKVPTQAGFAAAPGGIVLETTDHLAQYRQQASTAVATGYMPLANMTQMTAVERAGLLSWLENSAD